VTLLAATNLSKSYAGVRVLDAVDFDVRAGEIHALLGENGAGKSTLIKILAGAVVPDTGDVTLDAGRLPIGDPLAVRRAGLSVVYQEFTLAPELTVAENVFLGRERAGIFLHVLPFLHRAEMNRAAQAVLDELGIHVAATTIVRGLSVAHQQMVEIARALVSDAKLLVLDEPSATLSHVEVDRLFAVLRRLRDRGLGIVYISHRLEEIFALADRVTVLRDGRTVASAPAAGLDRTALIRWMVGRDVSEEFPARHQSPGAVVLEARGLAAPPRFSDVSLTVREGEIVGLAGLVGAGRTSTALALAGALPAKGDVRVNGRPAHFTSPADAIAHGVVYVTEDRKAQGLFPLMGVDANITITYLSMFARAGVLSLARERTAAAAAAREYDVRAATLTQPVATLSGGNQQKVLLARYMLKRPTLVVLDEPTRGVDVGARAEIYGLMNRLTAEGLAIVMISSDLPEVLGMSDRVIVMREGRTTGELTRAEATPERVMALAMAG
jgi:ABC-type sugar transport system ATPase subunit